VPQKSPDRTRTGAALSITTAGHGMQRPVPVHVSIHDVSPAWAPEVELALELAQAVGAKPALLVVPNYHRHAPLTSDPRLCALLRDLQSAGHEVFLHGFFHLSRDQDPPDQGVVAAFKRAFAQRVVSAGEAEFSDVSREEAAARLDEGGRMLKSLGLAVNGFVPPAWSMPSWLMPLLAERGYRYTEDHTRIYNPTGGRSRPSAVLNFASRTPVRLLSSVAYCRMATPLRALVPTRLAIHPADMRFALLRQEVKRLLEWARTDIAPRASGLFD
jgi:predicted deacetylase